MPPFEKANAYSRNGLQGRPKGSRNKLCRAMVDDLAAEWAEGGAAALRIMRIEQPANFVRCALSILPRELLVESAAADLDDDQLDDLIGRIQQHVLDARSEPILIEAKKETVDAE